MDNKIFVVNFFVKVIATLLTRQSLWRSSSAHAVSSRKGRAVSSRRNNTLLPATGVGDASSRRDVSALFCFYLRGFKRRQIGGTMRKFGVALAVGAC